MVSLVAGASMSPHVSVITATYNAATELGYTIASLQKQVTRGFEWIVVDGGSTDNTVPMLEENSSLVSQLLKEPDTGMYAAWNKAIDAAKGEWLLFLGAGDELACPQVLGGVIPMLHQAFPQFEMVYGRIQLMEQNSRRVLCEVGEEWEDLAAQWTLYRPGLPCHPEVFHHRSMFERGERFSTAYRYAADTEFMLRQGRNKPFLHIPVAVTKMTLGGQTGQLRNLRAISEETRKIAAACGYKPSKSHCLIQYIKLLAADFLVKTLPVNTVGTVEVYARRLVCLFKSFKISDRHV